MNILNKVTVKTLLKNKSRTLVTIIGISLSFTMYTAIMVGYDSIRDFLLDGVALNEGQWETHIVNVGAEEYQAAESDTNKLNDLVTVQNLGYIQGSDIEGSEDAFISYRPYFYIGGIEGDLAGQFNIGLTGRMPENENEIILPNSYAENGGKQYQIGDTFSGTLGMRELSEEVYLEEIDNSQRDDRYLFQDTHCLANIKGEEDAEHFKPIEERSFTVVGFYDDIDSGFNRTYSPGYAALTVPSPSGYKSYELYIKLKDPSSVYSFVKENFPQSYEAENYYVNKEYLGLQGYMENSLMAALYSILTVLSVLIAIASISLIYNSFSISINERIKQMGLLKSIGATRKQMMRSVMWEAVILGIIAIPLGVMIGITGMGITFLCIGDMVQSMFNGSWVHHSLMDLEVSPIPILIGIVIGMATTIISTMVPAIRACRTSPMEAIRLSGEVKIKARKLHTFKLTQKLFGFEATIASKNYKRSRKKYRSTVFSIFISIVLFVGASTFTQYLSSLLTFAGVGFQADIMVSCASSNEYIELYDKLKLSEGVTNSALSSVFTREYVDGNGGCVAIRPEDAAGIMEPGEDGLVYIPAVIIFADDDQYREYLKKHGLDEEKYLDSDSPSALMCGNFFHRGSDGATQKADLLKNGTAQVEYRFYNVPEDYYLAGSSETKNVFENNDGKQIILDKENISTLKIDIGAQIEEMPFGAENPVGLDMITIVLPYSMRDILPGGQVMMSFDSSNHKATYDAMVTAIGEMEYSDNYSITDIAEQVGMITGIITVINVFSYGFIALISLIAVTNIFNTISTNVLLRRREFAMLNSVGLSRKGERKMMSFECLLYGFKGLIYGVPAAIAISLLMKMWVQSDGEYVPETILPWGSICISVVSVFIIIGISMIYASHKLKKGNTVEALKAENF